MVCLAVIHGHLPNIGRDDVAPAYSDLGASRVGRIKGLLEGRSVWQGADSVANEHALVATRDGIDRECGQTEERLCRPYQLGGVGVGGVGVGGLTGGCLRWVRISFDW